MSTMAYSPLYHLRRGAVVESVHYGAAAVVDSAGHLLAWVGNAHVITFLRSAAKPFQALPFVEQGGVEHFGLTAEELALMCASHSGTDRHVAVARRLQQKAGVEEADLQCGTHPPYDNATAEALRQRGEAPTPNRHNCSGKHSGMLAHARLRGLPLESYLAPEHPVQQSILQVMSQMAGLPPEEIALGTDGCSAPNFAMPLYHAAWAYARLVDPWDQPAARQAACRQIVSAMTGHPWLVGGPGRFDTRLMEVAGQKLVAKGGAEGFQGVGIRPQPGERGIGIALKIADGDAKNRARPAVVLEILQQLGVLGVEELQALADFGPRRPVYNWRRLVVGEGSPAFSLQRA